MKINIKHGSPESFSADLLVVPVEAAAESKAQSGRTNKKSAKQKKSSAKKSWKSFFSSKVAATLSGIDSAAGGALREEIERYEYRPGGGKRLEISYPAKNGGARVRLSGVQQGGRNSDEWRKLGGDALLSAKRLRAKKVAIYLGDFAGSAQIIESIVEGLILADYQFLEYKSKAKKKNAVPAPAQIELLVGGKKSSELDAAVMRAVTAANAVCYARDLVNTPPSDLPPSQLLKHARTVAAKSKGQIKLQAYDRKALTRLGAFSLLGVARGSDLEPYLLHLKYVPKKKSRGKKVITLIGKGVTFDSGGLSIKTGKGMEDMKCDMSGAACVLSVIKAISELAASDRPGHEVHVIIPTVENMVSGDSIKPGDVIAAINGKTIEVLNTDAEGRLILADALCYAERIKSDLIIDLATLTGACVVALGSDYAGMFNTDKKFEQALLSASERSGEHLWPLPLAMEYRGQMESDVADLRNIGTGGPGAIIGALFLKEFVPAGTPWAHLDIAGPAFVTKGNEYIKRGGTGFGVLTLLELLRTLPA